MKTVKTFCPTTLFQPNDGDDIGKCHCVVRQHTDEEDVDCSVEYRVKFKYDYPRSMPMLSHARWGLLRFML